MALSQDDTPTPNSEPTAQQAAIRQRVAACEYLGDRLTYTAEKLATAADRETQLVRYGQLVEVGQLIRAEVMGIGEDLGAAGAV